MDGLYRQISADRRPERVGTFEHAPDRRIIRDTNGVLHYNCGIGPPPKNAHHANWPWQFSHYNHHMTSFSRRHFLLLSASLPFAPLTFAGIGNTGADGRTEQAARHLARLEDGFPGRLGVFILDIGNGAELAYRAGERFPLCSTFKLLLVAAILQHSQQDAGLLTKRLPIAESDLVSYSPITAKQSNNGMSVAALCAAALQYSDNTAANLLLKQVGGPAALTAFARTIGDPDFRLDRWETVLNSAIPDDPRDTTSPRAMGRSLQRLMLSKGRGQPLAGPQQTQLIDWLKGNTTGTARIRAGVPGDWQVADKTGSGDFGTANDVAIVWPPGRAPLIVAIYSTQLVKEAKADSELIAAASRIAVDWWREAAAANSAAPIG